MYGQVFVVTRGAANIRLGQLDVCLVPRAAFENLRLGARASALIADWKGALVKAKARGDEAEHLVSEIKVSYSALIAQRNQLIDRLPATQLIHAKYDAVKEEIKKCDTSLNDFRSGLGSMPTDSYDQCGDILRALKSVPHQLALEAYDHLIPLSVTCKTDADGRFRFECSLSQQYVVFTRGRRLTLSGNGEEYEWFVSAPPSRDEKRQILLTNDNLIDGPAADNLMPDTSSSEYRITEEIPSSQSRSLPERKPLPAEPEWAPPGYYFLLSYYSVPTASGVTGISPGSQVKELRHNGDTYAVQSQDLTFDVPLAKLTDNANVARQLREADAGAQTQIATWQAAEHEVEQQNKDARNDSYDEAHRRLEEMNSRLRDLRFKSLLDKPEHR